ncbi:MAG: hypothetical protein UX80_C0026G0005 [Candidatus Amesbacteria bacterium GW2011_GWA2_47_11b]|uniref:Transposase IS200-like domain-containing protein n=3 Tax=Candidatus Amesiibacteriota TaxID=1752730 RepID=A0A0G1VA69_9BACT|nr:MAG: hypothetical protein UX42_C0024G0005 [Microgenomates group bacterium GW2011_GWC1_46_20]KKU57094.1 MAG: hypothetical protein UX80_C0026G0005 [Candidatus Amesbacteria bacterium GW2011_GWA2_47_11b]KKU66935.1 MAG: hypothetical protein UX92_C0034G0005 [Candidatus Amesbacteria bacterium GW2011_GWA1_47_20]KKU83882.1 MAG: hypothetical protein UY11_C0012G0017 [Candidatus Amesbacteria bacterium GW2011_GWC2_47_8]
MPSRFIVRNLRENCVYHIYNRGVGEEKVFKDAQDFRVFLFYLFVYTTPIEKIMQRYSDLPRRLREKSLLGKLEIVAYTLLPNHFHLILCQHQIDGMPRLMKQVVNGFTAYYNQKYKHSGAVFLGRYKAVEVSEGNLTDLVRYIHREPGDDYEWSSYGRYVGKESFLDCDIDEVMDKYSTREEFIGFHEDTGGYTKSLEKIRSILIES